MGVDGLEKEFEKLFSQKKKNFEIKIFFYFVSRPSTPQKFHDFIFHPLCLNGFVLGDLRLQFNFSNFLQKTTFFPPYKMRFSIEIQNEPKMFFHSLPAAEKATGLNRKTIQDVLERGNKVYHRKSDHKLFTISKEDPVLVAKIEGEDFFSLEEIHEKLGLSPTRFLNQIKSGKFAKKIDWISDELFPESEAKRAKQDVEKPDEIKILREEMKSQFEKYQEEMRSQFEKYQTEISKFQAEIDRLSAKVETLEKEKASLPGFARLRSQEAKPKVFNPPGTFDSLSFNFKSLAKFIRNGFVNIRSDEPKTHRYVLVNDKREYLPDLVKQIFQDHILPAMEYGSEEERKKKMEAISNNFDAKKAGMSLGEFFALRRKIRILEETTIMEVVAEVMKLI